MSAKANIALYGRSGSGKSTVAHILTSEFGYIHLKTGTACRNICLNLFGSDDKEILNKVTDALREIDSSVWLRAALSSNQPRSNKPIVLDSIRFLPDYQYIINHSFLTVKVTAPTEDRVDRLSSRGQGFDLGRDDGHPSEVELQLEHFDATLDNSGTIQDLTDQINKLIRV